MQQWSQVGEAWNMLHSMVADLEYIQHLSHILQQLTCLPPTCSPDSSAMATMINRLAIRLQSLLTKASEISITEVSLLDYIRGKCNYLWSLLWWWSPNCNFSSPEEGKHDTNTTNFYFSWIFRLLNEHVSDHDIWKNWWSCNKGNYYTIVQWTNLNRNNSFIYLQQLPLFYKIFRAIILSLVGLMVEGRQNTGKFKFKSCYRSKIYICLTNIQHYKNRINTVVFWLNCGF